MTYSLTFITAQGGIAPHQNVGNLGFVRGLIRLWQSDPEYACFDRVCLLEVPQAGKTYRGQAFVFNREEALCWANK